MDWWFKRKLNEKASDRQGDGATARWFSRSGHHPAAELLSSGIDFLIISKVHQLCHI